MSLFIDQMLARYAEPINDTIQAHLPQREPRRWLYDLVATYPERAGKGLRGALCLASARAHGAPDDEAVPTAAALELMHNAFLVHDDIEDGSDRRRGAPTLHFEHGLPLAINAGDALAIVALSPLRENLSLLGSRMAQLISADVQRMMEITVEGQAIELGWRRDHVLDVKAPDYLSMVLRKTCAYTTIYPIRLGAIIGTWNRAILCPLHRFGFLLGALFQIRDDMLSLEPDSVAFGKEHLDDLHEGKRTLMIIHLLDAATGEDARTIEEFMTSPSRSDLAVEEIRDLMDKYGSLDWAAEYSRGLALEAKGAFQSAFGDLPPTEDRDFLEALIDFVTFRQR